MKKYNFDKLVPRENTNCVKWDLRSLFFKKDDVLPLWVADMDFETPDFILERLKSRLNHPVLGYTFRDSDFNKAFINWVDRKYQWKVNNDWVGFSPGVVSAVSMAVMGFTNPGEEIIVQPPVYFPFFKSVEGLDRKLVYNPLKPLDGRLRMDFDHLENTINSQTRMLILCNPHNPGGSAWTKDELNRLGDICARHDIFVLSDEIHADLVFKPLQHQPFAKINQDKNIKSISCFAASKSFNLAGLASSLVVIPDADVKKKYDELLQTVHIGGGNIFGSIATQTAYQDGSDWLEQLMDYLQANLDYLVSYFKKYLPEVKVFIPEATYLVWLDFSSLDFDDKELSEKIINEANLGLNPGPMFGPGGEGFMRLNFACPREILTEAMNNLKTVLG